jgi:hypothetical protein
MKSFYCADETGSPIGPYTLDELKALFSTAHINEESWIFPEGGDEWLTLKTVFDIEGPPVALEPTTTGPQTKRYQSLYRRYKDQPNSEIFSFFWSNRAAGETWEGPFHRLAEMAKKEVWNFHREEFRKQGMRLPILHNYLNYTFLRLQEQEKIVYSEDQSEACFNTGLLTGDEKEIFALFRRNAENLEASDRTDWTSIGFFDTYSNEISPYRARLPQMATYIEDVTELVLDTSYEIDVNIGHILDDPNNQSRLPAGIRNNRNLALAAIEGATKFLKQKVVRNYKVAIPQWYPPAKRIQLLLPLCIMQPDKADLALVAEKDEQAQVYRIRTALRMDMAYSNARLITRPDREWLDP